MTNLRRVSGSLDQHANMSNKCLATTLQDVRLELTRRETLQLASGQVPRHKVTMMGYFSMGFDIEDQQCVCLGIDMFYCSNIYSDLF